MRCATAGVVAVHVHPRDDDGTESLDPAVIAAAVTAIRDARPGLPVGVSTGAWIVPDPAERAAAVRAWTVLPDFASVNAHEPGAAGVAAALHERGVMVEAGLWTLSAVDARRRWSTPTGRILVECMAERVETALADAAAILAALPDGHPPVLLPGRARPPGRCTRRRSGGVCTPGSAWRTRCCCPTALRPRQRHPGNHSPHHRRPLTHPARPTRPAPLPPAPARPAPAAPARLIMKLTALPVRFVQANFMIEPVNLMIVRGGREEGREGRRASLAGVPVTARLARRGDQGVCVTGGAVG
ncbi:3-keto-5-aminohexanoate cleavage protein [Micromonospora sp. BRA006-A]|nr:3-keto-5-aminohexanoate cleavage protein [Micromonospora sp. BRA006-A]